MKSKKTESTIKNILFGQADGSCILFTTQPVFLDHYEDTNIKYKQEKSAWLIKSQPIKSTLAV